MKLIRPTTLTDAMLSSSTAPENDHPVWVAGTAYAVGARVILTATHRRYEALAGSTGISPSSDPTKWLDIGPTNRWAMFDARVGTATTRAGSLEVTLAPSATDGVALIDTDAETATVKLTVSGTQLYSRTQSFNAGGTAIDSWFAWFFEPLGKKSSMLFLDIPVYETGVLTVTMARDNPADLVSCGTLLVGRQFDIGDTDHGVDLGIIDYSRKETDQFGVTSVVERAFAKRMTARVVMQTSAIDDVHRTLAAIRATPVLWIGSEGFESLTVFGFYKEFSIDLAYPTVSYCSLTIEGLT
jgi:chitodextrinase